MRSLHVLISIGLIAGLIGTAEIAPLGAQTPPSYIPEFLGEALNISAMNQSGQCVGTTTTGGIRGWTASSGAGLTPLPLPPGDLSSYANDINDAGVIVGAASKTSSPEFGGRAVAWLPDGSGGYTIQELGKLPGHVNSIAVALNNLGDIVGYSSDGTFRSPVLFTAPGGVLDLSPTGVFDPQAINDQRILVDRSFTCKRLDLDTMIVEDLGVPTGGPGTYLSTAGAAINESNQVAGVAILATSTNCDRQAARYTDGIGWEILSVCGPSNGAYDMNDLGDVVMRLNVAPHVRFEGVGTFKIEDLIVNNFGHWYVINGFGLSINNARKMAVPAKNLVTGQTGVVLLSPEICQKDLGFGGPGNMQLSICGDDLTFPQSKALFLLEGAVPFSRVFLVVGAVYNPTPLLGGTLVPFPWLAVIDSFHANGAGEWSFFIQGGGGTPVTLYLQALVYNGPVLEFSNALQLEIGT